MNQHFRKEYLCRIIDILGVEGEIRRCWKDWKDYEQEAVVDLWLNRADVRDILTRLGAIENLAAEGLCPQWVKDSREGKRQLGALWNGDEVRLANAKLAELWEQAGGEEESPKPGLSLRPVGGFDRIQYDPEWSSSKPYCIFLAGTATCQARTLIEAKWHLDPNSKRRVKYDEWK